MIINSCYFVVLSDGGSGDGGGGVCMCFPTLGFAGVILFISCSHGYN